MREDPATGTDSRGTEPRESGGYQVLIFDPEMLLPFTPANPASRLLAADGAAAGPTPSHRRPVPAIGTAELPPPPAPIAHDLLARFSRPVDAANFGFILEPATGSLPPAGPGWRTYFYGRHVLYVRIEA